MNSYELSRNFYDWAFENPEKIKPNHAALYFFAIEHCNRLAWKEKFGFQFTNLNGNYISYSYSGDFSNLEIAYLELYKWLAENTKLKIANKPSIEIYKKFPPYYSPKDSEMDILIPIQS
jgi:DNA gyrase inhibitor GyrI